MEKIKEILEENPRDITDLRLIFRKLKDLVEIAKMRGERVRMSIFIVSPEDYSPKR